MLTFSIGRIEALKILNEGFARQDDFSPSDFLKSGFRTESGPKLYEVSIHFDAAQLNYLLVCHRKLWLYSHDIKMEHEDENVRLGKSIGESIYDREKKEINLDNQIVLDWAETKAGDDGVLTIHEVKKSKAVSRAHRLQMLFYLHFLKGKGVAARGVIDYPELKVRETMELDGKAEAELESELAKVAVIVNLETPPARLDKLSFCSKCAYYDLCYVG